MNIATDTRQRLINSARDLLYARSYGHVGVKEICDAAGVQKGSFYHFFPSKQDLALSVLDEHYVALKENIFTRAFRPEYPPLERISKLVENIYAFQKRVKEQTGKALGCPYGNIASELGSLDEPIRQHTVTLFKRIEAEIHACLEEAVSKGDIPPLDTAASARAMFAYIEGMLLMAKARNDPEVIRELGSAILGIRVG
ncbi:TetR/AcrR family transcriptional regulator [Thiothrix subterranea]|uniref:TetR/AcrR family transcriptional regulator n=1 Tax=Thiothrix subterranea TaxID=2735563 RepID=A0AA51QVL9_9GAMM|nr:TetR/AcrR family transcriptional regulator [Thiothrix subterranea]MDQ5771024.1 TetR/AcrR family transcriptional regulator [Thiothrix subterranea]WML84893.1 TetR/AcrR family transcriptional regulator [Thiothrix subterranea]